CLTFMAIPSAAGKLRRFHFFLARINKILRFVYTFRYFLRLLNNSYTIDYSERLFACQDIFVDFQI
ncbi:MAG: hypothetical protein IJ264_09485, partial [Clostridia bacterium]|nr:hypothetical protein [Clostridia bacterium]